MKTFLTNLTRLLRHNGGNVATIFSLALVPISVMGGGAVDFAQAMNARGRLAEALDAAALAVGSQTSLSIRDSERLAMDYITANYPAREIGNVHSVTVSVDDDEGIVTVTGQSRVDTTLLGIMGMDYINVDWTSEVRRAQQNLELVMVLDNTGSMRGSKINSLRDSAELLTDILFSGAQEDDDVRIGLVPFAATVNVGREFERVSWLDPNGLADYHGNWYWLASEIAGLGGRDDNPGSGLSSHWDLYDGLRRTRWEGCVEARPIPYDVEDIAPTESDRTSLFVPFFAPDEPDNGGYDNSYLRDGRRLFSFLDRLLNLGKYNRGRPRNGGPNEGCTTTPITPLTSRRRSVENAIAAMDASGTTNIPNGISWGVRVLSPQEPFTDAVDYSDRNTIKAMVILTDGDNFWRGGNGSLMSEYGAYGYAAEGRAGVTSSSSNRLGDALDDRTVAACAYARAQGIRVYTITFQVNSSSTRRMMEDCASHPSLYFDSPSNAALQQTFEVIAGDLSNLRISR